MHKISLATLDDSYSLAKQTCSNEVTLDSPASVVLTDFSTTLPRMLESSVTLKQAKNLMIKEHVKLKIVIDKNERMIGSVSYRDLAGEKPIILAKDQGGIGKLQVSDVMVPLSKLTAIPLSELEVSSIGDVVTALQKEHVQHVFVVDIATKRVVGMISASDVARKLCYPFVIEEGPTFHSIFKLG